MSLVYAVKTIPLQAIDARFEDNFLNNPKIYSIVSENEIIFNNCSPILLGVEYGVNPCEFTSNYHDPSDSLSFKCPFSILRNKKDIFKILDFNELEIINFNKGLFTTLFNKNILFRR